MPGIENDEIKTRIVLPSPTGPIIPPEAAQERPIHAPRRMALRQEDVIKARFTAGCPGCLDINSGRGGMRGSATHNEECRKKVEDYLRRTKSKRMAAYEGNVTARLVRYDPRLQVAGPPPMVWLAIGAGFAAPALLWRCCGALALLWRCCGSAVAMLGSAVALLRRCFGAASALWRRCGAAVALL